MWKETEERCSQCNPHAHHRVNRSLYLSYTKCGPHISFTSPSLLKNPGHNPTYCNPEELNYQDRGNPPPTPEDSNEYVPIPILLLTCNELSLNIP